MFKRFMQRNTDRTNKDQLKDLRDFYEEIDTKQKEIAEKKAEAKKEHDLGSRITKHRFTI